MGKYWHSSLDLGILRSHGALSFLVELCHGPVVSQADATSSVAALKM